MSLLSSVFQRIWFLWRCIELHSLTSSSIKGLNTRFLSVCFFVELVFFKFDSSNSVLFFIENIEKISSVVSAYWDFADVSLIPACNVVSPWSYDLFCRLFINWQFSCIFHLFLSFKNNLRSCVLKPLVTEMLAWLLFYYPDTLKSPLAVQKQYSCLQCRRYLCGLFDVVSSSLLCRRCFLSLTLRNLNGVKCSGAKRSENKIQTQTFLVKTDAAVKRNIRSWKKTLPLSSLSVLAATCVSGDKASGAAVRIVSVCLKKNQFLFKGRHE